MKQSSKRFTSMILALVLLAASLLIFFDLIQPTYNDLETKKGTEAGNAQLLQSEQTVVNQAKSLLSQYQSENQGQGNLALAMPSGPDLSGAIAQLYGIAQNNDITITSINVSAPGVQVETPNQNDGSTALTASDIVKPVGTISFQISASGTYESLKSFLVGLETNIRIFDVKALSLASANSPIVVAPVKGATAPTAPSTDFFTYTLSVATYYQTP